MDKNLQSYLKIYSDWLTPEVCEETVEELEKVEGQFQTHQFYDYQNDSHHSYNNELSVTWSNVKHKNYIMQRIWDAYKQYTTHYNFPWFSSWSGFSEVRFNMYKETRLMAEHCDHIHSMFDGERKGVPTMTFLAMLNGDYTGGEFVMWGDEVIPMGEGTAVVFPSCFLYPHRVDPVTSGTRYSCVSWAW